MKLAEKRQLDLDAPIQKYCPAFPVKPWTITARELMSHLSGIRHYRDDEDTNVRHFSNIVDALVLFKDDPLLQPPGQKFVYSTYGFSVLGCAIEGVSHKDFVSYLRDEVWNPAGMTKTAADDVLALIPHRAQGYKKAANGKIRNSDLADTSNKIPGGGMVATASDLIRFILALQKKTLLSATSMETLYTEQTTVKGEPTSYGLGWELGRRHGYREIYHGGAQERVSNVLYFIPEKKVGVAILSNLEDLHLRDLARNLVDIVQKNPLP
jgi:CubicO group peptidase (beta-lactamase class C family)